MNAGDWEIIEVYYRAPCLGETKLASFQVAVTEGEGQDNGFLNVANTFV